MREGHVWVHTWWETLHWAKSGHFAAGAAKLTIRCRAGGKLANGETRQQKRRRIVAEFIGRCFYLVEGRVWFPLCTTVRSHLLYFVLRLHWNSVWLLFPIIFFDLLTRPSARSVWSLSGFIVCEQPLVSSHVLFVIFPPDFVLFVLLFFLSAFFFF